MTLNNISNGPQWTLWAVFALILILSIVLLSGHGAWLVAGYNTAGSEEKSRYDEKKMCRIMGAGMAVIAALLFVMAMWMDVLPVAFAFVFLAVTVADTAAMIVLVNTVCKK